MEYNAEAERVKQRFIDQFTPWMKDFYGTGDKPAVTPANPQGKGITKGAAVRTANSIAGMPAGVNPTNNRYGNVLDDLDNRLTKGDSVKSILGAFRGRVQKATSGSDGARLAVTPYDAMHHQNPLGTYGPSLRAQSPEVRLEFLERAADEGYFFSETDPNLKGHSLDPRSHDAGTGGAGKNAYARHYGERPVRELSAHPRGTGDPLILPDTEFKTGKEMYEAAKPILEQNALDVEIGKAADAPRRDFLNNVLNKEFGTTLDYFGKETDESSIKQAQKFLRGRPDLLEGAAKVWTPKEARKLIAKLSAASLVGVGMLGTGADAAETAIRTKVAADTKDPVDALQAAISAASTTVGATGVGEILGIPLELVNMMIDQARGGGTKMNNTRSQVKARERKAAQQRRKQSQKALQGS
jgi:hypothetical protein